MSEMRAATSGVTPQLEEADRAYAIYTSGTTGTPKGVLIGASAFRSAVVSTVQLLRLSVDTRTLCVSPFHFDGSFGTLFPTLAAGGSVVIPPRESLLFPQTFFRAIINEQITYTGFSPSYLRLLLASPAVSKLASSSLAVVALGGEACSASDVEALWAVMPGLKVFNRYGPTETTIAVTHFELDRNSLAHGGAVPIGRPHPDVTFYLVDTTGTLVDGSGAVGELYIGGAQLMEGYWADPELTDEVIRSDIVAGQRLYRTGDLVYRDEHGNYIYVDRADKVIKRQGVRISLVEVAEALRNLAGISAATCAAYDNAGHPGIAAFVVATTPLGPLDIRKAASASLPSTMLPDIIEVVDSLPLTSSGKVDDRSLLRAAGLEHS
jgi:acyl-CoA synthetase (AMP-forming)/AMP-acid ligase II